MTVEAREDLAWIAEDGRRRYSRDRVAVYIDDLFAQFDSLAATPYAARERIETGSNIRLVPFGSHHILYRIVDEDVLILRILHGRQDWLKFTS